MLLDHNVCADMMEYIDGASYDVYLYMYLQYGRSPLMGASHQGHVEIVKLLLDMGAEVNYQNMVSYS